MKAIKSCWSFFIYSNLFVAGCAALMTAQSWEFFTPGARTNFPLFVFFSTLCSYSFHWYFTGPSAIASPRVGWLQQYRRVHVLFFVIGLAGSIIFFFKDYTAYWLWIAGAIIATFLYSAPKLPNPQLQLLRNLALGKTIFLAAVWTYVTTVLPFVIQADTWSFSNTLFTISRYFAVYMICILFDYRDRADDKNAGIRSLITYMEPAGIKWLFLFSFLVFIASTLLLYQEGVAPFHLLLLLLPGFIVASLYRRATSNFSDMLYYFILDGLMAFSALLTLFTRI